MRQLASVRANRGIVGGSSSVMGNSENLKWPNLNLPSSGKKGGKYSIKSGLGVFFPTPRPDSLIGVKKRGFWIDGDALIRLARRDRRVE